jgi:excisionase family DNA binding protein
MATPAALAANQSSGSGERYLRGAEVAELLQVSSKTVARWAKDGKLPYLRTLGVIAAIRSSASGRWWTSSP